MNTELQEMLEKVSGNPGVYLMKNASGTILYIGKAANLKKRLTSYFKTSDHPDIKTAALISRITSFDTIITASEQDAFILESNLIKQHKPKYNVILKDDKRYPSLRLDVKNPYPNLQIVRKPEKNGALYFGPFSSAHAVRETLRVIHKTFKIRKCKPDRVKERSRPCLNYQIGRCLGPCCGRVTPEQYSGIVKDISLFLKGRAPELMKSIRSEMMKAAECQDFEKAIFLRDQLASIEKTTEKKSAVITDFKDRDIFAASRSDDNAAVTLMTVRGGYLQSVLPYHFRDILASDQELLTSFIRQYYEKTDFVPEEILTSLYLEDTPVILDWFKTVKGQKPAIICPQKGDKFLLIKTALQNGDQFLKDLIQDETIHRDLLIRLQQELKLKKIPFRIECFDNSTLQGSQSVSGMVVFQNGKPNKSAYRRYRIKTVSIPDDYAGMAEILTRRFGKQEPLPDLLLIDGGKGQLNIALSVLKDLQIPLDFDIIGIAKRDPDKGETEDKLYKPERANPIVVRDKKLRLFLESIRNEAHRFAISFHRKKRKSEAMRSVLDEVPGVGTKRKKTLLMQFGSIENIRAASIDELSRLPGMNRKVALDVLKAVNPAFSEPL